MSTEFDVILTDKDMFRFNMYHTYHGFRGIFAAVIGILILVAARVTAGKVASIYTALYIILGIIFLIYMPVSLYLNSKRQISSSEVFRHPLHYKVDEEGVHVSQNNQGAALLWNQIYRIICTKSNVIIYSSRINAYIIPRNTICENYEIIIQLAESHLEKYRLKLKSNR